MEAGVTAVVVTEAVVTEAAARSGRPGLPVH